MQDLKAFPQPQQREIPLAVRKHRWTLEQQDPRRMKSYMKSLEAPPQLSKAKICIVSYELIKDHHLQGLHSLMCLRVNRAVAFSFFLSVSAPEGFYKVKLWIHAVWIPPSWNKGEQNILFSGWFTDIHAATNNNSSSHQVNIYRHPMHQPTVTHWPHFAECARRG